jgi:hypothetical protein
MINHAKNNATLIYVLKFCIDNFERSIDFDPDGRWHIDRMPFSNTKITFINDDDAVMFKLWYVEGKINDC